MENKTQTPKMRRQRRFILMLPLLALPFITMIFWSLGGGNAAKATGQSAKAAGFNLNLPDANLKEGNLKNKMDYYDQARLDSAKFQELVRNDPNYSSQGTGPLSEGGHPQTQRAAGLNTSLYTRGSLNDPAAEKIYSKLEELNREMNRSAGGSAAGNGYATNEYDGGGRGAQRPAEAQQLEQMMQSMDPPGGGDPEMEQLNGMLEKILDIQNPNRVQDKLKKASAAKRGQVFAVTADPNEQSVSVLEPGQVLAGQTSGFYALDNLPLTDVSQNAIQALVHETQVIVNGSTIKFRLLNDIMINGTRIPKGNFIYGTAALTGERLGISINSVRYRNSLFPVELSVFDMDGLDGIYIPGAISREVAKESADRSMQDIGFSSLDPSFGGQAAGAGIEAVKTLFSKKVKLVKVTVKAGYRVLLRDEKQKQDNFNQ